jgi:hypothetical protein
LRKRDGDAANKRRKSGNSFHEILELTDCTQRGTGCNHLAKTTPLREANNGRLIRYFQRKVLAKSFCERNAIENKN